MQVGSTGVASLAYKGSLFVRKAKIRNPKHEILNNLE
jgi:hypothetical protein